MVVAAGFSGQDGMQDRYIETFRTYIRWGVEHLQQQIRPPDPNSSTPTTRIEEQGQTLHALSYALKLAEHSPAVWDTVSALIVNLAPCLEEAGYRDAWIPYLETALNLSRTMGDEAIAAELNLQLGQLYQISNRLGLAQRSLAQSAATFATLQMVTHQAQALNRLAYIDRLQRNYPAARARVQQALALLDEADSERETSYFVLGTVALDEGEWESAQAFFEQALALCQRDGDVGKIARRTGALGVALLNQRRYPEAIEHYRQAIELLDDERDAAQRAILRFNLGNVYLEVGEAARAREFYIAAEPVLDTARDELHLAMLHTSDGAACRQLAQWAQSEESLHKAMALWERVGNTIGLVKAMNELGVVYRQQKMYDKAHSIFCRAEEHLLQNDADPAYQALGLIVTMHRHEVEGMLNL